MVNSNDQRTMNIHLYKSKYKHTYYGNVENPKQAESLSSIILNPSWKWKYVVEINVFQQGMHNDYLSV